MNDPLLWATISIGASIFVLVIIYLSLVAYLPIWMQRPYYAGWRRRQIQRHKDGCIHPAIDPIMVMFYEQRAEIEFKAGGIRRVVMAANYIVEMVAGSFEFQMILAEEISRMGVSVTVIAVPPPDGDRKQG